MATRKKPNAEYEAMARVLARLAELERKVALLEAQPREQHTHYHTSPYVVPSQPQSPGWTWPIIVAYSSDVVGGTAPPCVKVGTAA